MRKYTLFMLVLFVVALALVACELPRAPMTMKVCRCDRLPYLFPLRTEMLKESSGDQFLSWISVTYGLPTGSIRVTDISEKEKIFEWEKGGIRYRTTMRESALVTVWAEYEAEPIPSAECVVTCLGAPEQYAAYFTRDVPGRSLQLEMIFPAQGVLVQGAAFYGLSQEQPPPITGTFPISFFRMEAAETAEDILHKVYGDLDLYVQMVEQFKPWPGSWQDIEITIDPSFGQ